MTCLVPNRLTPVYLIVIGSFATLFSRTGDGPLWAAKAGLEAERCAQNWWTNLLYVNNYVNPGDMVRPRVTSGDLWH